MLLIACLKLILDIMGQNKEFKRLQDHYLKLTLDILELIMKSKKGVLSVLNSIFET